MWTILESSADKSAHLPEFDEPLLLGQNAEQTHFKRKSVWLRVLTASAYSVGIVFLSATLAAQWMYFNRVEAMSDPSLRAYWQTFCDYANCELPVASDADALRSVLLDINEDPDRPQVLQVRFRIQNASKVPQRFPAVELSFSNTQNELVAARRFYPGHYLSPNAFAMQHLRPAAEIDGLLEIQNPGVDAVNYAIQFVYERTPD